jgi:hypothetical protein
MAHALSYGWEGHGEGDWCWIVREGRCRYGRCWPACCAVLSRNLNLYQNRIPYYEFPTVVSGLWSLSQVRLQLIVETQSAAFGVTTAPLPRLPFKLYSLHVYVVNPALFCR